jgi:hypothetical protein
MGRFRELRQVVKAKIEAWVLPEEEPVPLKEMGNDDWWFYIDTAGRDIRALGFRTPPGREMFCFRCRGKSCDYEHTGFFYDVRSAAVKHYRRHAFGQAWNAANTSR